MDNLRNMSYADYLSAKRAILKDEPTLVERDKHRDESIDSDRANLIQNTTEMARVKIHDPSNEVERDNRPDTPIESYRANQINEPKVVERLFKAFKVPHLKKPDMIVNGVPHNCHPDCCGKYKPKEHLRVIELRNRLLCLQDLQSLLWNEFERLATLSEQVDANIATYREALDFIATNALKRTALYKGE